MRYSVRARDLRLSTDLSLPGKASSLSRKWAAGGGALTCPRIGRLRQSACSRAVKDSGRNQSPNRLRLQRSRPSVRDRYWWRARGLKVGELLGASPAAPRVPSWFSRRAGGACLGYDWEEETRKFSFRIIILILN